MKGHIWARPGKLFAELDLSQVENRLVAAYAEDARMLEAFAKGQDVHSLTAGLIFGKDPADISRVPGSSKLGDGKHSERDWGKRANHALNYGMGPLLLASEYEIPAKDGKWLHSAYHRAYPNVQGVFWKEVKDSLYKGRTLENAFGRKRMFLAPLNEEVFKVAYSFKPQSTAADLLNRWGLVGCCKGKDVGLINQVHDALVFEMEPTYENAIFLQQLIHSLTQPFTIKNREVRIPIDLKLGPCYGTMQEVDHNHSANTILNAMNLLTQSEAVS